MDLDTSGLEPAEIHFNPRVPPFGSMRAVAVEVLGYLFDT